MRRQTLLIPGFLLVVLPGLLGGCTAARIVHDTGAGLEWVRLKSGTEIRSPSRWQLPADSYIEVVETSAAPDATWLPAAQRGVDSVFLPEPLPGSHVFQLLVSWPGAHAAELPAHVGFWDVVTVDALLPDFQQAMAVRVALVRSPDGALVQNAELAVSPRWLASPSSGPVLVRDAFRELAESLRPAY